MNRKSQDTPCTFDLPASRPVSPAELRAFRARMREAFDGGGSPHVTSVQVRFLLQEPQFLKLVTDCYRAEGGREFDTLTPEPQEVVARTIAAMYLKRAEGGLGSLLPSTGIPAARITGAEKAQIVHAAANPRQGWCQPPLFAGDWTELDAQDAAAALLMLSNSLGLGSQRIPVAIAINADKARTCPLACYPDALAIEIQGYGAGGRPGVMAFIARSSFVTIGDGGSAGIHDLNDACPPVLDTPQARLAYMRLFLNWVRAGEGRFQAVESGDEADHRLADPKDRARMREAARPLREYMVDPDGGWRFETAVLYGDGLYFADFLLTAQGMVEMVGEAPFPSKAAPPLAIQPEIVDGPLFTLGETAVSQRKESA